MKRREEEQKRKEEEERLARSKEERERKEWEAIPKWRRNLYEKKGLKQGNWKSDIIPQSNAPTNQVTRGRLLFESLQQITNHNS